MARSKHSTTGNGTHRQRIFKAKQATLAAHRAEIKQMSLATHSIPAINEGGIDLVSPEVAMDVTDYLGEFPITKSSAKDDGLGHSHEDENLQDTLRELKGMIANDKHEQLMDTFVEGEANVV